MSIARVILLYALLYLLSYIFNFGMKTEGFQIEIIRIFMITFMKKNDSKLSCSIGPLTQMLYYMILYCGLLQFHSL